MFSVGCFVKYLFIMKKIKRSLFLKDDYKGNIMREIKEENIKILKEYTRLRDEAERLEKEWYCQVKESCKGKVSYNDTKAKFDEQVKAYDKWQEYRFKHGEIIYSQPVKSD